MWPLAPLSVVLVVTVTVAASATLARHARHMRRSAYRALRTGDPRAVVDACEQLARAHRLHCRTTVPVLCGGAALLVTQCVACMVELIR